MGVELWMILAGAGGVCFLGMVLFVGLRFHRRSRRRRYYHNIELNEARERLQEPLRISADARETAEERSDRVVNAMFYLRSCSSYSMDTVLEKIGHRYEKSYFLVGRGGVQELMAMTILRGETQKRLGLHTEAGREVFSETLSALAHPYIYPVLHVDFLPVKRLLFVFRTLAPKGSLRDHIYHNNPRDVFVSKYRPERGQQGLSAKRVGIYGRQILEAVAFLEANRVPVTSLQTSNIIVSDGACRLTDLENTLLGATPQFQIARGELAHDPVHAFGHVLFEMACGYALDSAVMEMVPPSCPKPVATVLVRILGVGERRKGMSEGLTVGDLLAEPLFSQARVRGLDSSLRGAQVLPPRSRDLVRAARKHARRMRSRAAEARITSGPETATSGNDDPSSSLRGRSSLHGDIYASAPARPSSHDADDAAARGGATGRASAASGKPPHANNNNNNNGNNNGNNNNGNNGGDRENRHGDRGDRGGAASNSGILASAPARAMGSASAGSVSSGSRRRKTTRGESVSGRSRRSGSKSGGAPMPPPPPPPPSGSVPKEVAKPAPARNALLESIRNPQIKLKKADA